MILDLLTKLVIESSKTKEQKDTKLLKFIIVSKMKDMKEFKQIILPWVHCYLPWFLECYHSDALIKMINTSGILLEEATSRTFSLKYILPLKNSTRRET